VAAEIMAEQKIHRSPRMSINALSQYLVATAARRERILHDQKYPPVFRARWYEHASRAILRYLLDPDHDVDYLNAAEQRIRALPAADKNSRQKNRDNADAVTAFRALCSAIAFDDLTTSRGPEQGNSLVEGVTVSVRPEVVLGGQYRNENCVGGIKVYLSKNDRLSEDGAATIGSMVHLFMEHNAPSGHSCKLRHCKVIDVFGRSCTTAPQAVHRRRAEIQAACREIAQRWPTI
jgi:hypothetical protein